MATGDMRNNLRKLQKQVSFIRYSIDLDYEGLAKGNVAAHLPILYHAFFKFSPKVVEHLAKMDYSLAGKKDAAFMNIVFKIMRDHDRNCELTLKVSQFMSTGFAERKVIMTTSIIELVRKTLSLSASNRSHTVNKLAVSQAIVCSRGIIANISEQKPNSWKEAPDIDARQIPASLSTAPQMQSTVRGGLLVAAPTDLSASTILQATIVQEPAVHSDLVKCGTFMHERLPDVAADGKELHGGIPDVLADREDFHNNEMHEIKITIQMLQRRQDELEKENGLLKDNLIVAKNKILTLSNEVESAQQRPQITYSDEVLARLDIIESKIATINSVISNQICSPVCGLSLCSHFQRLQPTHNDNTLSVTDEDEKSLMDVTNEILIGETRMQGTNLMKLVQGTRTLLGMSDVSDLQTVVPKSEDAENEPPIEIENGS